MADGWLIMAVKVKDHSATSLKNEITQASAVVAGRTLTRRFMAFAHGLLNALNGGTKRGNVFATILASGTVSTGNIACTRANAAGDTLTFTYGTKTVVLTEATSPVGENQYARGASDTTCAANLATCINAHSILGPLLTALGAVGDCGLTANLPTALLQDIAITTSDATAFTLTQLTGGTEGTAQMFPIHFDTGYAS